MPDAPAPVAPEAPPVAPAAVETPPEAPAAPPAPAASGDNLPDDPAALKTMIADLRKENGSARTTAKAQAAEEARNELVQSLGKALGLVKDEVIDPATLTASLTTSQAEAKQARVELAVFRNATAAGGDPAALLDSSSFLKSLDAVDPADTAAVTTAIQAAVTANPRLGAVGAPEVRVPAPVPGQGAAGASSDLQTQLAEATKAGDFQKSIAIRQAIAAELRKA